MMALFVRLLLLAVFISVTTAVIQTSDGFMGCRVPDNNSSIHHVQTNLSEGEFDLLQIEGYCFLFCTTEIYNNEVNKNKCCNDCIQILKYKRNGPTIHF